MDAFSEILSGVKLTGAIFFSAELSEPWGISVPATERTATLLQTGPEHLVIYHLLLHGAARVQVDGGQSLDLVSGDVVVFPHSDAHRMYSRDGGPEPFPDYGINTKIRCRDLSPLRAGGGGPVARFVCGYMRCEPYLSRPILNGLPAVFKVNIRTDRAGEWLRIPSCTLWRKPLRSV
jgi:hypothetical protein